MSRGKDAGLRRQLVAARADIVAQLNQLYERAGRTRSIRWDGGSPGYGSVIAELEGELRDIDALLGPEGGAEG